MRLTKCFAAGGPRLSLSLHTPPPPPAPHATWPPLLHACPTIPPAALLCRHGDGLDQRVHLHHVGDDPPALGLALGSGLGSGAGVRFICILQVMGQPRAASQGTDANARVSMRAWGSRACSRGGGGWRGGRRGGRGGRRRWGGGGGHAHMSQQHAVVSQMSRFVSLGRVRVRVSAHHRGDAGLAAPPPRAPCTRPAPPSLQRSRRALPLCPRKVRRACPAQAVRRRPCDYGTAQGLCAAQHARGVGGLCARRTLGPISSPARRSSRRWPARPGRRTPSSQ